ncbi:MAG: aromatic acid exporter family protein [Clostridium sp.]
MKFKLGMRNIKSGIAVMLCCMLGQYVIENLFFAVVACAISVQDTVKGSVKAGLGRVKGTILGGLIGYLTVLIKPGDPILCGLGVMAVIYGCTALKSPGLVVSLVTFSAIHLGNIVTDPAYYAMHRVIDTSMGVVFGVIVNYMFARPDYFETTINEFINMEKLSKEFIKLRIINNENFDIEKYGLAFNKLENTYSKFLDEMDFSKNSINTDELEDAIGVCEQIYFHMKSIELLEQKLYLNKQNYKKLKKFYKGQELDWEIDDAKSPVFNFHLGKIIEKIDQLNCISHNS